MFRKVFIECSRFLCDPYSATEPMKQAYFRTRSTAGGCIWRIYPRPALEDHPTSFHCKRCWSGELSKTQGERGQSLKACQFKMVGPNPSPNGLSVSRAQVFFLSSSVEAEVVAISKPRSQRKCPSRRRQDTPKL